MGPYLESGFPGTWTWTLQTGVVQVDSQVAELLGFSDTIRSFNSIENFKNWVYFEDREQFSECLNDILSGMREHGDVQHRFKRDDGEVIWVSTRLTCLRNKTGKPKILIGSTSDLSEKKDSENQLNKFELALQHSQQGAIFSDRGAESDSFLIHFLNPAAQRVFGMSAEELHGKCLFSIFPDYFKPEITRNLFAGRDVSIEGYHFSPVVDTGGQLTSIVCLCRQQVNEPSPSLTSEDSVGIFKDLTFAKSSRQVFHALNNSLAIVYGRIEQFIRKIDRDDVCIDVFRKDLDRTREVLDGMAQSIREPVMRSYKSGSANHEYFRLFEVLSETVDQNILSKFEVEYETDTASAPLKDVTSALSLILSSLNKEQLKSGKLVFRSCEVEIIMDERITEGLQNIIAGALMVDGCRLTKTAEGYLVSLVQDRAEAA